MLILKAIKEPFDKYYKKYEKWFDRNENVYKSELKAVKNFIPKNKKGLEIGVGSGKFAGPLGIKAGIEPSEKMRKIAKQRGIEVYDGVGEDLPFAKASFDFVLMVTTICFLNDVEKTLKEIKRVLKDKSPVIIGFVDKKSKLGEEYLEKKQDNVFYKEATFYSTTQVIELLKKYNFSDIEVVQTIFGKLSEIKTIQSFQKGYGKGGFVVIKANT